MSKSAFGPGRKQFSEKVLEKLPKDVKRYVHGKVPGLLAKVRTMMSEEASEEHGSNRKEKL